MPVTGFQSEDGLVAFLSSHRFILLLVRVRNMHLPGSGPVLENKESSVDKTEMAPSPSGSREW